MYFRNKFKGVGCTSSLVSPSACGMIEDPGPGDQHGGQALRGGEIARGVQIQSQRWGAGHLEPQLLLHLRREHGALPNPLSILH